MVRDRLSGATGEHPPSPSAFGRWVFDKAKSLDGVFCNGCPARAGEILPPGLTGHWALVRPGDPAPLRGRFFADGVPDEQDVEALLELGRMLELEGPSWLEWAGLSPLAPSYDALLREHPLEIHIANEIHHLTAVCRNPRTHIEMQTERVLVSRARRLAVAAPTWLSAHTEDWGYRTLRGVQPRRILAEVREEQWDLYENRVAARLIDQLITWLRRRIVEVERVREGIFEPLEQVKDVVTGSRQRSGRLFALWGQAWEAQERGATLIGEAKARLERQLYALLGLMDSPLYRQIPRRAEVPRALRSTNLLANDDHYRGVARLWHQWSRLLVPRLPTPAEHYARQQALDRAFVAWCALLVVRACDQLRLSPTNDELEQPFSRGRRVEFDGDLSLEWEGSGPLALRRGNRLLLRIVPLVHALDAARTPAARRAQLDDLADGVAELDHWTVVLHPAVPGIRGPNETAGVGRPPWPGARGSIDFVRVSPFALDSVERVARAIRWVVLAPRMLAYPPLTGSGTPALVGALGPGFDARGSRNMAMLRPPLDYEVERLDLRGKLRRAQDDLEHLQAQRDAVDEQLRACRGDRRKTRELNLQKKDLVRPLEDTRRVYNSLDEFARQYNEGRRFLDALATCPVCASTGRFELRGGDCFEVQCETSSCSARWGLRLPPNEPRRVPYLLPGSVEPCAWPKGASPQWVDELLGSDVLAIPQVDRDGGIGLMPPRETPRCIDDATKPGPAGNTSDLPPDRDRLTRR